MSAIALRHVGTTKVDKCRVETVEALHGSIHIKAVINDNGELLKAQFRQFHRGRAHSTWGKVTPNQPFWNDIAAAASRYRQEHRLAAKALQDA